MTRSKLELEFERIARLQGLSGYAIEYRFDPTRRWRFDFAWPEERVAVECDGAVYARGRHTRGYGFEGDCEKLNAATRQGWRVLRYTGGMLKRDPVGVVREIMEVLGN